MSAKEVTDALWLRRQFPPEKLELARTQFEQLAIAWVDFTETPINHQAVRAFIRTYRAAYGLSLRAFWLPMGFGIATGSSYEDREENREFSARCLNALCQTYWLPMVKECTRTPCLFTDEEISVMQQLLGNDRKREALLTKVLPLLDMGYTTNWVQANNLKSEVRKRLLEVVD